MIAASSSTPDAINYLMRKSNNHQLDTTTNQMFNIRNNNNRFNVTMSKAITTTTSNHILMQWPLPDYRPQHSPDYLYHSFEF